MSREQDIAAAAEDLAARFAANRDAVDGPAACPILLALDVIAIQTAYGPHDVDALGIRGYVTPERT